MANILADQKRLLGSESKTKNIDFLHREMYF